MGIWAIVPVKHLKEGKSRLESVLSPRARELFSRRILKRTLGLLALSDIIERTVVISRDDTALQMARELGALIVNESSASDLNCALQRATQVAASLGATGVLVLPSDLPLLGANDVEEITRPKPGGISDSKPRPGAESHPIEPFGGGLKKLARSYAGIDSLDGGREHLSRNPSTEPTLSRQPSSTKPASPTSLELGTCPARSS